MKVSRVLSKKVYFDEIELWISASIDSNGRFIEGGVYSCEEHCYNMERDIYNILSNKILPKPIPLLFDDT